MNLHELSLSEDELLLLKGMIENIGWDFHHASAEHDLLNKLWEQIDALENAE
ncbi:MAG: hypothetical protein WBA07_32850 [Rivularia sp. (in: cyanobacteria)]